MSLRAGRSDSHSPGRAQGAVADLHRYRPPWSAHPCRAGERRRRPAHRRSHRPVTACRRLAGPTPGRIAAMSGGDYFDRKLDAAAKPHRPISPRSPPWMMIVSSSVWWRRPSGPRSICGSGSAPMGAAVRLARVRGHRRRPGLAGPAGHDQGRPVNPAGGELAAPPAEQERILVRRDPRGQWLNRARTAGW